VSSPVLELRSVQAGYGGDKTVLHDVDLSVAAGELVLLMGHNGAGKTTLLRTVFGELQATQGDILYRGAALRGKSSERVRGGISYTAGGRAVYAGLTVSENLAINAAVVENDRTKVAERRALVLVQRLYRSIADIRKRLGLAVLVVEQTINPSMLAADHVYVLRMGEIVFRGGAETLKDGAQLWNLL